MPGSNTAIFPPGDCPSGEIHSPSTCAGLGLPHTVTCDFSLLSSQEFPLASHEKIPVSWSSHLPPSWFSTLFCWSISFSILADLERGHDGQ